jgi:hypothetical protein
MTPPMEIIAIYTQRSASSTTAIAAGTYMTRFELSLQTDFGFSLLAILRRVTRLNSRCEPIIDNLLIVMLVRQRHLVWEVMYQDTIRWG